jgi:hypothetical protein
MDTWPEKWRYWTLAKSLHIENRKLILLFPLKYSESRVPYIFGSTWAKCYKTFCGRNLRMSVISKKCLSLAGLSSLV